MLDEWIEGHSLRNTRSGTAARPERPLVETPQTIGFESAVDLAREQVRERGLRPGLMRGIVPRHQVATGRPLVTPLPPSKEDDTFTPWFDTVDGSLPPVHAREELGDDEVAAALLRPAVLVERGEVVDPEWVYIPGEGFTAPAYDGEAQLGRRMPSLGSSDVAASRQLSNMDPWRRIITIGVLLLVVVLVAFVVFAPSDLFSPTNSDGEEDAPPAVTGEQPSEAPAEQESALLQATNTPSATVLAHEQGLLAFASDRDGDFDIYLLNVETGEQVQLTDDPSADRSPAWSPDGERIVFVSDRAGDDDLYVMDADGGNLITLTTDGSADHNPAWSPDGHRIVFAREGFTGSDILALDIDCIDGEGTCEDVLETISEGRYDREPSWSPRSDELAIAAADFPGLPAAVALIGADGSAYRPLEGTGGNDDASAWSPDGDWLAFVSNTLGDYDLWLMEPDGSGPQQLTEDTGADVHPAWSPDGEHLVFASDRAPVGTFDLYVIPIACADDGPGACDEAIVALTDDLGNDLDPAWLP